MIRAKSLAWRIFIASLLLMPILLGFSAFMLDRAFRASLFSAEEESLRAHTYSMIAAAEPEDTELYLPQTLDANDPRYNTPDSGLFAQIVDGQNQPVWQSVSLAISPVTDKIPFKAMPAGEFAFDIAKIDGRFFSISRFNTVWEFDDIDKEFQFVIIHSQAPLKLEISRYRRTLYSWLGGLAMLLIILQTVIIRWGLSPLKRLAYDIKQLEAGSISTLNEDYPDEIIPVTHNINLLIDSEQKQRSRYKNTLADLAHSLKTPLSVIRSILDKETTKDKPNINEDRWRHAIDDQIDRMSNIVTHQLNRASSTKPSFQSAINMRAIVDRIGIALSKVYHEKKIQLSIDIHPTLEYSADEGDMMEVIGNLVENAFKYGRSRVDISAAHANNVLNIFIEDDGDGIAETLRTDILKRGARADTSLPGQGIGLSVAAEIISAYDGGIVIDESQFGGAKFTISLPQ